MSTILPDGSAFDVVSLPLPVDHWIYSTGKGASPIPLCICKRIVIEY